MQDRRTVFIIHDKHGNPCSINYRRIVDGYPEPVKDILSAKFFPTSTLAESFALHSANFTIKKWVITIEEITE